MKISANRTLVYLVGLLVFIGTIISCKENKKPSLTLYDEVIAIHDDVMPKMADIHRLRKQLRHTLQSSDTIGNKDEILEAIRDLDMADDGMMDWMAALDVPEKEPQKTTYLNQQKTEIIKVRDDMLSSIANAQTLVSKK